MAENSSIEWTDHTFNAWIGCTRISPGCNNCYAAAQDKFRGWTPEGWGGPRRRTSASNWREPLRWNEHAKTEGRRMRVFCASLADVFDNEVPPQWRADLFDLIRRTPNLDWLLLTKRIGNAMRMLPWAAEGAPRNMVAGSAVWPNVWLGATIVNQEEADRDIPKLLATPARVRFLSMEPLLGPVDLDRIARPPSPADRRMPGYSEVERFFRSALHGQDGLRMKDGKEWFGAPGELRGIEWVIVGGESGPGARPMQPEWAENIREQCAAAGVPFFFKQWGAWGPDGVRRDKKRNGRELAGKHWNALPLSDEAC